VKVVLIIVGRSARTGEDTSASSSIQKIPATRANFLKDIVLILFYFAVLKGLKHWLVGFGISAVTKGSVPKQKKASKGHSRGVL
jgi:hypothetical protein